MIEFDFSALNLIPGSFSMSLSQAEHILKLIADFFAVLFDYFVNFILVGTGFKLIFAATLFIVALARLVISPIVGGRSFDLGTDRVRKSRKAE